MRLLCAFAGGLGHWHPIVPIAGAAQAVGHTVAVASDPLRAGAIAGDGFEIVPLASARGERGDSTTTAAIAPLLVPDLAREEEQFRDRFAGSVARERAGALVEAAAAWRPDVLVCDEADYGAMVAAECLDVPHATVHVLATGSFVRPELVAEAVDAVRAAHGLAPDPAMAMPARDLVLVPFPPSLRDPTAPMPRTAHFVRPTRGAAREGARPSAGRPLVYLTLGTVFNVESGDLFWRLLRGLGDLPVDVVATVGPQLDPDAFGPQPANVRVERFVPQHEILPGCRLVVSHGGSGSVVGALAHGLPSVLVPMGADQPLNARRCEELGVARVLDAVHVTAADVGHAAATVLSTASYRERSEQIRDEIAALPDPAHAVTRLERLGRG